MKKEKKKYIIPSLLLNKLSCDRIYWSKNKKMLRLYNKNSMKWQTFYKVRQVLTSYGYFGETKYLDKYWENTILEKLK